LLALGRRTQTVGATEIYEFATGKLVSALDNRPLAVSWSNNGSTLAILESATEESQAHTTEVPMHEQARLRLWKLGEGTIASWDVGFAPSTPGRYHPLLVNRFALSWNADDSLVAVSTRKVIANEMEPRCTIVAIASGCVTTERASDAYCVGKDELVANENGDWKSARRFRFSGGQLQKLTTIGGSLFAVSSDPGSGVFLAYHPPSLLSIKRFTLPVVFHSVSGGLPVRASTGFAFGSSLRLFRSSDFPVPSALGRR
jgi:hypothetical protein